jgi:hypothetical protein
MAKEEIMKHELVAPLFELVDKDHHGFLAMFRKGWPYVIAMMFWLVSMGVAIKAEDRPNRVAGGS